MAFNPFTGTLDKITGKKTEVLEIEGDTTTPVAKFKDGTTDVLDIKLGSYSATLDVKSAEPTNLASNGTFETDLTGWEPSGTVLDSDGNSYTIVQVGTQYWLDSNMRYLPAVSPPTSGSDQNTPYYYVYGYSGTNVTDAKAYTISGTNIWSTEGVLYNWSAAMAGSVTEGAQGICPSGWHIPKDSEQNTLDQYLTDSPNTCNASRNGSYDCIAAGTKLKSGGSTGFTALLAGYRGTGGAFYNRSSDTLFWSSSSSGSSAWHRDLYSGSSGVARDLGSKAFGLSVRAISDWNTTVAITRDTGTKYAGSASAKIVTPSMYGYALNQSLNVGDTNTYTISAYAYTTGAAVTSSDVQLYYNGSAITTNYTSAGSGWYLLTGTVTGANASRTWGVEVKAGKTVYIDNFSITAGSGAATTLYVLNSGTGLASFDVESTSTLKSGAADKQAVIAKGAAAQTANLQEWQNSSGTILAKIDASGGLVANETGADTDSRIEGDTDANLLYADAGNDRIGIGTATPATKLDVNGVITSRNGAVINEDGADSDTRIEGDTATNLLVVDAGLEAVQIGTTTAGVIADFRSGGIVLNEDGADRDTRIEGDTETHAVFVDASADMVYLGGATNAVKVAKGGELTLAGTATRWDDLRVEPVARTTGSNAPTFEKYFDDVAGTSRGVYLYSFDDVVEAQQKEIFFTMQMPHQWAGTSIYLHIHWVGSASDTTSAPRWGLEYCWQNLGNTYGDTTIIYSDGKNYTATGDDADITAGKHYIGKFAAIDPSTTANAISSVLIGRVFRQSSAAEDTYNVGGNKCGLLYIDAHYEIDAFGSSTEYTK